MAVSERARGADDIFGGPGEMNDRARAFDWASTSLGPVEGWPQALRTIVRTTMDSPFAVNLWCGPDKILIYNDAYRRVLGVKHPDALGRPGRVVWREIWKDVEPMFRQIDGGGPPVFAENQRFAMARQRDDELGDAWFTFGLSAVRDDAGNTVAYFNPAAETTGQVLAELAAVAAGAAAARSEARLREVFAQAPAFMAVLRGPEHCFEFANPAYMQLIGRTNGIIGKTVEEVLPEVRGQGFITLLDNVLSSGEAFVGREVPVVLNGASRYVDFVYQPLIEGDGTRAGVVAHGVDVTEQVLARRQVERLLEDSRRAADSLSRANQRLAEQQAELEAQNEALQGNATELEEQAEELQVTSEELAERTAAAEVALGELQTSERRLRLAADASSLGMWTWSPATDVVLFDARVRELFAMADARSPSAAMITERVHPADRALVAGSLAAAADPRGDGRYSTEFWIVRPDGSERRIESHGLMEFDGTGESRRPMSLIGTVQDVTSRFLAARERERLTEAAERARAEAEQARHEAEEANRAKSQFLATMSHELRTPLNAIGGYAELMEMGIQGPVTEPQREFLARIRRSQRHLLGLINEELNNARI